MINSVITTTTVHRVFRPKPSSDTSPSIYLGSSTPSSESFEEYEKRRAKEAEQEAKVIFYLMLIVSIIGTICFVLSIIYHK